MTRDHAEERSKFIESLSAFTREHRARHWDGTFREFVEDVLPANASALARTSHQYIWDLLRWAEA